MTGVAGRLLAAAMALALSLPGPAGAQAHRETAVASLVKVQCTFDDGSQMSSTGFAWNDSMHVVAALHAVVGCRERFIRKEGGLQTTAVIERASRVADLAYLRLEKDIGLQPAEAVAHLSSTDGDFYTWGYPHGLYLSSTQLTRFDGGQRDGPIPLRLAFLGVGQIESLFETQNYPQMDTAVLRVSTPLQPGQSGAPIIDTEGRVVAIADGGLLEGFRGINWSIPAFLYLDGLPDSEDVIPSERSSWAALYSKVTPAALSSDGETAGPTGRIEGLNENLRLVRNIKLVDFEDILRSKDETDDSYEDVKAFLDDIETIREITRPDDFARLSFDVYEDQVTGATLGVPSRLSGEWDDETGWLSVETPGDAEVGIRIGYWIYDTFDQSISEGTDYFLEDVALWLDWSNDTSTVANMSIPVSSSDREFEKVYFYDSVEVTYGEENYPYEVFLSVDVWENELLGYAVYGPKDLDDLTDSDYVDLLMMEMSALYLSGFAEF